jgi:TorA maturation chaperone TorD
VRGVPAPALSLLSRLWLSEPDAATLALANDAGIPCEDNPAAMSAAWTDLFLLNVYPYGSAFTDASGELNGPSAAWAAERFRSADYDPPELATSGAPDHAGLCLGYLAHLGETGRSDPEFLAWALEWIPVCSLAVERQPAPPPFYRALAEATREILLARASSPLPEHNLLPAIQPEAEESELNLSAVVRRLLAPAASGFFLSRSRLGAIALDAGMRLPFGSRHDVARALFEAAGESGRVEVVLEGLGLEADAWDASYSRIADASPGWASRAAKWRGRVVETRALLSGMAGILDSPLELEYGSEERIGTGGP